MRTEVIRITPQIAQGFLETNHNNRNISERLVKKYSQDMLNNQWTTTHQGIAFYEDGTLADGQHRLFGIVRSGCTVTMHVTYGLKREQAINIDANRPRSAIDGIKIGQLSDWIESRHITMCNLLTLPKRLTTVEMVKFLETIADSAQFATEAFPTNRKMLTPSIIQGALCLAHAAGEKPAMLRRFGEVMLSGLPESPSEKVIILCREAFLRSSVNGESEKMEKLLKTQRAIDAFCSGTEVKRLTAPTEPIYSFEGLF
jgi:hypothetical protein